MLNAAALLAASVVAVAARRIEYPNDGNCGRCCRQADKRGGMERLRKAGVWLTIDPQAIAGGFNTDKGI